LQLGHLANTDKDFCNIIEKISKNILKEDRKEEYKEIERNKYDKFDFSDISKAVNLTVGIAGQK